MMLRRQEVEMGSGRRRYWERDLLRVAGTAQPAEWSRSQIQDKRGGNLGRGTAQYLHTYEMNESKSYLGILGMLTFTEIMTRIGKVKDFMQYNWTMKTTCIDRSFLLTGQ